MDFITDRSYEMFNIVRGLESWRFLHVYIYFPQTLDLC